MTMPHTIAPAEAEPAPAQPSPGQMLRRRVLDHWSLLGGAGILGLIIAVAALASVLSPDDPYRQDLMARLVPPVWYPEGSWTHLLGTDHLGRDYLSRLLHGAQVSLLIGFAAALGSGLIGTTIGICAGYFGGKVDMAATFLITVRLSTPVVLVALAVVALFGGSLEVVIVVLSALLWDRYAIVMRSSTQLAMSQDYVLAARAVGCSVPRIIFGEILPNVLNNLIIIATLEMAHAILLEAALSFLGLGVQPPLPSWGLMVAEGRANLFFEPWLIAIPGAALFLLVLSINLVGDGIRDVTSPEGRN